MRIIAYDRATQAIPSRRRLQSEGRRKLVAADAGSGAARGPDPPGLTAFFPGGQTADGRRCPRGRHQAGTDEIGRESI